MKIQFNYKNSKGIALLVILFVIGLAVGYFAGDILF